MGSLGLFKIRIISEDKERLEKLDDIEKDALFDELTLEHARGLALYARKRLSDVLKKSHKFNVGASDAASENLYVPSSPDVGKTGYYEFSVYEGNATKANFFIRRGFGPTKEGRSIPRNKIREWVADKGIVLRDFSKKSFDKKDKSKIYRRTNKYGTTFTQSTKKKPAEIALSKIIEKLSQTGSRYSNWVRLNPEGQGRFDYPGYIANQTKGFKKQMQQIGDESAVALASYLASGYLRSGAYPRTGRKYRA